MLNPQQPESFSSSLIDGPDESGLTSERMSFLALMHPTFVAAIFHLIPNPFPFLPPSEWAAAGEADFLREMLFFNALHAWLPVNSATVSAMI